MAIREHDLKAWIMDTVREGLTNEKGISRLYFNPQTEDFTIVNHTPNAYDDCILLFEQEWYDLMRYEDYRDWYNPQEHEWDTWQEMQRYDIEQFEDLVVWWTEQAIENKIYEVKVDHLLDILDDVTTKLESEGIEVEYE
jgi:hypothetical protein